MQDIIIRNNKENNKRKHTTMCQDFLREKPKREKPQDISSAKYSTK